MLLKDDSNLFCSNWLIPLKLVPLSLPALNLGFYYPSIGFKGSAATAKSLQSCPTLCNPIDGSPPGPPPIPGILQASILKWVAISFSNTWKWKNKVKSLSCVWPSVTPWTAAFQAPPSMRFSRQEYWSGVPSPSPLKGLSHHDLEGKAVATRDTNFMQREMENLAIGNN